MGVDGAEGDKQAPGPAVICEHEGHRWRHVGVSVGSRLRVRVRSLQAGHWQVQRPRGRRGAGHAGKELGSVTVVSCGGDVEGSVSGRAGWTLGPRVEASTVVRTRDKADEGAGCRGVAGTRLCGSS